MKTTNITPVTVHTKKTQWPELDKPVAVTAVACSTRSYDNLTVVTAEGETKTISYSDTVEGYRFTRKFGRFLKLLSRIAKEGAAARARDAKAAVVALSLARVATGPARSASTARS